MSRTRFKTEVKLFAINERAEGKGWQIIRQQIGEKFGVKPPTVRAMEKWQKTMNPEAIKTELMKDAKSQLPKIGAEAQITIAQGLLPVLLAARTAGEDPEATAWKWFFEWIEKFLGREKFKQLVEEYFKEHEGASETTTEEEAA